MQTEIKGGTTTVGNNTYNSALLVTSTLNDTSDSGSHIYKLIEGVATNTDITGWDELYLLHLTGASTFWVSNAGDVALAATKKLYLDGGGDTYISEAASDILRFYVGGDLMLELDEANDEISMSATNYNMALADGTRFSATNSAYAGMILGYTRIQNDSTTSGYGMIAINTSSMTVLQTGQGTDLSIQFIVPPSGNVEIECSFWMSALSDGAKFSLSTGTSYAELGETHTYDADQTIYIDESDHNMYTIKFAVTGLTPGTDTTYYLAGLASGIGVNIGHGRNRTIGTHYPPILLKAIALPSTITTGE
jgi:hypothetical protein